MSSIVCTLFEGSYHLGLGALANSLHLSGFRGRIWAGFRGDLPPWAAPIEARKGWAGYKFGDGCEICFVPVETSRHLTNYKPEFMLGVLDQFEPDADAAFYFDPDIVVKCAWNFFEEWAACGVALCEDVNSPLDPTHPLRRRWQRFFSEHGIHVNSAVTQYVNAGFVGVRRERAGFLRQWQRAQSLVEASLGDLKSMNLRDRTFLFQKTDQDALNVTLYSTAEPASLIGKEAMDFVAGGCTMSHAIGAEKPWQKKFVRRAVTGLPPSPADKAFWRHTEQPIDLFTTRERLGKQLALRAGAGIGRFVRRS